MEPLTEAGPHYREQKPAQARKLAAILHADIAGFSRLMGEDEAGTHRALSELRAEVDPLIAEQGGRIVSTAGDSVLADFPSVVNALACAIAMQRASRSFNAKFPASRRLELRIGVNLGDVIVDGTDIFGDGVNIAARLEALAAPGTICISHTVYEQVRRKLDVGYQPLGTHRVKNIAEPVRAYAVIADAAEGGSSRRTRSWLIPLSVSGAALAVATLYAAWTLSRTGEVSVRRSDDPVARVETVRDDASNTRPGASSAISVVAGPQSQMEARPSIAVLPFRNLSGDAGQDFFSDGVTEDIIAALSRFSNLLVISKSSSFPFRNSTASPAEIGRQVNARYLLDGSIRRSGNRIRAAVQLIEAQTGRLVWTESYDAELDDIFAVQDNIARNVVGAAAVQVTRLERDRARASPTSNLVAYEYVLRGRGAWSHEKRESLDDAADLFQQAIDLDPSYADAYAELGGTFVEAVTSGWSEFRSDDMERAEALALKALALSPSTTRAYHVLSAVHIYRKRYDLALAQIDRALAFNPSDIENFIQRGTILGWAGRAAEALPWLETALKVDKANGVAAARLCMTYFMLGRYVDAVNACDLALTRNAGRNTQMTTHVILAATYAALNRAQDTARQLALVARLWPFFDARAFAAQFGTEEASAQMLAGLKAAGFR